MTRSIRTFVSGMIRRGPHPRRFPKTARHQPYSNCGWLSTPRQSKLAGSASDSIRGAASVRAASGALSKRGSWPNIAEHMVTPRPASTANGAFGAATDAPSLRKIAWYGARPARKVVRNGTADVSADTAAHDLGSAVEGPRVLPDQPLHAQTLASMNAAGAQTSPAARSRKRRSAGGTHGRPAPSYVSNEPTTVTTGRSTQTVQVGLRQWTHPRQPTRMQRPRRPRG